MFSHKSVKLCDFNANPRQGRIPCAYGQSCGPLNWKCHCGWEPVPGKSDLNWFECDLNWNSVQISIWFDLIGLDFRAIWFGQFKLNLIWELPCRQGLQGTSQPPQWKGYQATTTVAKVDCMYLVHGGQKRVTWRKRPGIAQSEYLDLAKGQGGVCVCVSLFSNRGCVTPRKRPGRSERCTWKIRMTWLGQYLAKRIDNKTKHVALFLQF